MSQTLTSCDTYPFRPVLNSAIAGAHEHHAGASSIRVLCGRLFRAEGFGVALCFIASLLPV